ncbi:MAG TPA: hypothetical protein VMU02_08760, partial [bacterium]|nr:hypothetical protein [bacterium]
MPSRTSTILLAGVLGFASTTSQVMVIRELLVAFTGNELTIALTLAIWLLAVGAGSLLAGRAPLAAARMVPGLMITAGLASVAQVLAIRLIVPWVSGFGQLVTPPALAVLSAVGILPCAVTFGALFVGLVARASTSGFGRPIAAIYGSEAVGSAVAGVALAAFLLEASSPIAVAAVAALVLVAGAAWMVGNWHGHAGVARRVLPVCGLLGLGLVLAAGGRLDLATRGAQWRPLKVVATADSKYGSLVVTGSDSIFQFFETGTLTFTVPDLRYAEECAHLPLLCHPAPRSVLVLGGAGSGIVEEVLKHPSVKQVDFVELDPRVISIVKELAPRGWLEGNAHTAVRAYSGDAREFTARARTAYDVVIVGAGMPTSLLINRYYTREFFRSIRKVLAPDGVVAVKLASPGASVSPEMAELVASVRNALGAVFPNTAMLPGDYVHILASPSLDVGAQARLVMERLHARELHPAFVNQYVLWDWLAPIRVAQLDSIVGSYDHGEINSDDKPVAFALALSLWEKQMAGAHGFLSPPRGLGLVGCVILLVVLSLLVIGFFAVGCRVPASALGPLVMVYTVGLLTMFTQVLIIVAFQIASGYIYGRIA